MLLVRCEDVRACDGKNSKMKKEEHGVLCTLGHLASGEERTTLVSRGPSVPNKVGISRITAGGIGPTVS